jgi:T1SS-143 domain-containing protein
MANTASNAASTANTNATTTDTAAQKTPATSGDAQPPQNILQGPTDVCVVEDKSDNPVLLERPEPETTKEVTLHPGQDYIFAFDKAEATSFVQDGNDLKITFDCGATLILKNYVSAVGGSEPATFAFSDAIPTGALDGLVKIAQAEEAAKEEEVQSEVREEEGEQQAQGEQQDDGTNVAKIEPAAGDADATKLAQIEPAAGDTGAAGGRGGYGFNSSYETTPVGPLNAVGPIDPTALRYDARFPEPDVTIENADDRPELSSPGNAIDETDLSGGPIVVGGTVNVDFGADGPGSIAPNGTFFSSGSQTGGTLSHNGDPIVVTPTANGYEGVANGVTVFTFAIDPVTGNYTFTLLESLDHADGSDDNDIVNLVFGVVATDGDGDQVSTSVTITVADDAPTIEGDGVKSVDEDDLTPTASVSASVSGDLTENFGADAQGDIHPTGTSSASGDLAGGVLSSDGHVVTINTTANGYEGVANGVTVFDITIDPITGAYTFNLYEPLDHSVGGDTIRLTFGAEIIDFDTDTAQTNIIIDIQDDEPKIVDGDDPKVGKGLENIDETNLGPIAVGGTVPVDFGADGPGSFGGNGSFNASGSMTGGQLQSHGVAVDVNLVGNAYEGRAGGTLVFTLQVNNDGSYTFTQFEQLDHADGNDDNDVIKLTFGVQVEDNDGDTATGSIIVNIADDVPTIDGDGTKMINEADLSPAVVNGNLVEDFGEDGQGNIHTTGTWNASGDLNGGTLTSDGQPVTVTSTANGYTGTANGQTVFTLTIDPVTGAYTFTLLGALDHSPGGSYIYLNFGAEIVDYDGDTDQADIVIKVIDDVPEIDDGNPVIGKGLEVVDETNLGPIVRDGSINFDFGGDGPGAFGPNGTYSSSVALTSGGVPVTITPSGTGYVGTANGATIFTMTINADGTYQFTLLGVLDHPIAGPTPADHDDIITLNFGVAVSDADGDSDTGNIIVRVHDDGPVAHDDFNTLDDVTNTASGNVITGLNGGPGAADDLSNDTFDTGAANHVTQISFNGNIVNVPASGTVSIDGDYGTLTIAADGTYTYEQFKVAAPLEFNETLLFPDLAEGVAISGPALNNLGIGNGVLTVPSDSTGTITFDGGITAYNDSLGAYTVGPDGTISEVQMLFANGENTTDGSNYAFAVGGGRTAGFFIIANGDVINGGYPGIDFSVGQMNFVYDYGLPTERAAKITDTADHLSLVYTSPSSVETVLQGPTYHSTERGDSADINPDGEVHVISGLAEDGDQTRLRIGFEDLPQLGDRDYGDVVFNLTLNINRGVCGTDEFLYTLTDGDGDTSQATLTLQCDDDKPIIVQPELVTVDETNLNPTTSISDSVQANFGNDGPGVIAGTGTFSGGPFTSHGQPITVEFNPAANTYTGTANGNQVFTLVIQSNGDYTFTLTGVIDHPNAADPNDAVNMNFGVRATDADGDSALAAITVRVLDDGPVAVNDTTSSTGGVVNGNVLTNDNAGKDGLGQVTAVEFGGTTVTVAAGASVDINGAFGVLHISSDGAFSYTANGGSDGTDVFKYIMRDYDGDTSSAKLTINVDNDDCPILVQPEKVIVDETNMNPTTSISDSVQANFGTDTPGSFSGTGTFNGGPFTSHGQPVTVGFNPVNNTYTGTANGTTIFTLALQTNGNYTFTLLGVLDHPNAADPNDALDMQFGVRATDSDGDSDTGIITVRVLDDGPVAVNDTGTSDGTTIIGNVLTNDNPGKDGLGQVTAVEFGGTTTNIGPGATVVINATYGTLTIRADGSFNYVPKAGAEGVDLFQYTMRDYDGDTATAKLKIGVDRDDCPILVHELAVVDETNMNPTTSVSDTVTADFGSDGFGSFSGTGGFTGGPFTSHGQPIAVSFNPANNTYTGTAGGSTVFTMVLHTSGFYTFTLIGVLDHPNAADPNDALDMNFGVRATDHDGDSATGNITIRVLDDGPVAVNDGNIAPTKAPVFGNVLTNDDPGSDGLGQVTKVTFGGTTLDIAAGQTVELKGQYGILHISSNGAYDYTTLNQGQGHRQLYLHNARL